jgi:hypothetical protein
MVIKFLGWSGLIAAPIGTYFINLTPPNAAIGNALAIYALIAIFGAAALFMDKSF